MTTCDVWGCPDPAILKLEGRTAEGSVFQVILESLSEPPRGTLLSVYCEPHGRDTLAFVARKFGGEPT